MNRNLSGLYCVVHGRVQGVGFRFSTVIQAKRLKLAGYVKNLYDGTVEVLAEGEKQNLDTLLSWLKKGPPGAYVTNVDSKYTSYSGVYRFFDIDY